MRHAEAVLQACLEDLGSSGRGVDQVLERRVARAVEREALRPLLVVAERCRRAPVVLPSAEFRQAARGRMLRLIAADAVSARTRASRPREADRLAERWWRRLGPARVAFAPALLALALAFALTAVGATAALAAPPTSPLFGARLLLEEARARLTPDQGERLQWRLTLGDRRAEEVAELAGVAEPGELVAAAERYQRALWAQLGEAGAAAPEALDARLAGQEELLRRSVEVSIGADAAVVGSLDAALSDIRRERARLRERHGWEDAATDPSASPTAGPTAGPTDGAEPGAVAPAEATPQPAVAAPTPEPAPGTPAGPEGGWRPGGGAPAAGTATPQPTSTPQERNRQQGPASATASPPRSPEATPGPGKPGGQGGTPRD